MNMEPKANRHGLYLAERNNKKTESEYVPRRYESWVFLFCGLVGFSSGLTTANFLFLTYLYGFHRVYTEGLELVSMPKGHPWIVSNGDIIDQATTSIHFFILAPCLGSMTLGLYCAIRHFLPVVPIEDSLAKANITKRVKHISRRAKRVFKRNQQRRKTHHNLMKFQTRMRARHTRTQLDTNHDGNEPVQAAKVNTA